MAARFQLLFRVMVNDLILIIMQRKLFHLLRRDVHPPYIIADQRRIAAINHDLHYRAKFPWRHA
jgi:hypothetical protein